MTDAIKTTGAVLDQMVAGIMEVKAHKATVLTPVGTEAAVQRLPRTPAMFPNDQPQEVVEQVITELDRQIGHLQEVVAALRLLTDKPAIEEVKVTPLTATILQNKDAEEMGDRLARITAEAQASVFTTLDEPIDMGPTPTGWTCPTHGDENLVPKTSGKGRNYIDCEVGTCKEFER